MYINGILDNTDTAAKIDSTQLSSCVVGIGQGYSWLDAVDDRYQGYIDDYALC